MSISSIINEQPGLTKVTYKHIIASFSGHCASPFGELLRRPAGPPVTTGYSTHTCRFVVFDNIYSPEAINSVDLEGNMVFLVVTVGIPHIIDHNVKLIKSQCCEMWS